jgi:hypothetical protein
MSTAKSTACRRTATDSLSRPLRHVNLPGFGVTLLLCSGPNKTVTTDYELHPTYTAVNSQLTTERERAGDPGLPDRSIGHEQPRVR